jgi:photosystem II stability/assembly factor-like uncharacterized protein
MATRTKKQRRAQKRQQVQEPKRVVQETQGLLDGRRGWLIAGATLAFGAALLAAVIYVGVSRDGTAAGEEPAVQAEPQAQPSGLPDTPDYHSLLVAPSDPGHILLGTHAGLYESTNGGRDWTKVALEGQDAMNLASSEGETLWTAGHEVFAKSSDGGVTWTDVRPDGLPSLDIHGFAVDPKDPGTLYAAVAGQGLYRSRDGGRSFSLVSREVGPGVMALGVTPDGRILAGDMEQGVMVSTDDGKSWKRVHEAGLMGLAINSKDPQRILATGPGILLSRDGGKTWEEALALADGAGPVAWAPSAPETAYVVGFDKTLYKTEDGGATWRPVA